MISSEQLTTGRIGADPSVGLIRELYQPPDDLYETILEELSVIKLDNPDDVTILLKPDSYVSLVAPNEMLNLYKALHIEPTDKSLVGLADYYFESDLPDTFDQQVPLHIRPIDMRHHVRRVSDKPGSDVEHYWEFRSPRNDDLAHERKAAKKTAYHYLGVSPERRKTLRMKQIWSDHDTGKLIVASVVGKQNLDAVASWIGNSEVLGKELLLDKATIDEV